jgi:hypothetical protein|tara:strand:+ start:17661 stop:17825 length:165 start_codon:yes stop_codon:yes gene_type:complete
VRCLFLQTEGCIPPNNPYYDITIASDTGEVKQSYFDEEPTVKIKGLKLNMKVKK